ncbi:hypothetical protein M758_UG114700 [Ceratodon purpureus]|nr:hypothetical protein M758_UG114700 [Ceratodon purpureus]
MIHSNSFRRVAARVGFSLAFSFVVQVRSSLNISVMGSCSTRTYLPATPNTTRGSLCALAVFQHFSNLELIKSVHLYMDDGSVTAVQQEFLLSPDVYTQISEPIPSYFSEFAHNGAKQFIDTLKQLNEADLWQCVLEYNVHTPQDTSIIPLLSVSKNPALYCIPTLAEDLVLVERAVQSPGLGHQQCIPLLGRDCQDDQQQYPGYGGQSYIDSTQFTWNSPKWNLAGFSGFDVESSSGMNESLDEGVHSESNSHGDNLHDWGSDLELASPRMFETCVLGSSWSTSISSMPFTGLMSGSCLISNVTAITKSDHSCWSPSSLVLESQMAGTYTFHEALPFSDDSNDGQVKLTTSSDASHTAALCHSGDLFLSPLCASSTISDRVSPRSPSLKKGVESAISYCSDESGNEAVVSERLPLACPSVGLPLDSQNCTASFDRDEVFLQQTCSYEPTDLGHDLGHVGECRSMTMLDEGAELCNQRGATERMTEITLHELSQYFHMPITQASKELKVGLTVLKKRCREFGIPRWPHRKMKSLDSLIQNIQELARGPEGGTSGPVMSAVKELEHQKKRMEERPGIELAERTKRLRQACFKASYKKRRQALTSLLQRDVGGETCPDSVVGELPSVQIR